MLWILGQLIWFCLMHRSYIYSRICSLQKISVFWAALTGRCTVYTLWAHKQTSSVCGHSLLNMQSTQYKLEVKPNVIFKEICLMIWIYDEFDVKIRLECQVNLDELDFGPFVKWNWFTDTHSNFLGFKFLVRNEEKNEIPCQGTRNIRGIFWPTYLPNLSPKSEQKWCTNFSKKPPNSWNTIFDSPYNFYCIFMH